VIIVVVRISDRIFAISTDVPGEIDGIRFADMHKDSKTGAFIVYPFTYEKMRIVESFISLKTSSFQLKLKLKQIGTKEVKNKLTLR